MSRRCDRELWAWPRPMPEERWSWDPLTPRVMWAAWRDEDGSMPCPEAVVVVHGRVMEHLRERPLRYLRAVEDDLRRSR